MLRAGLKVILSAVVMSYLFSMQRDRNAIAAETVSLPLAAAQPDIYARLDDGLWHRVYRQDEAGCEVGRQGQLFDAIWQVRGAPLEREATARVEWSALRLPLPAEEVVCWAYAMTYPDHRQEVRLKDSFRFPKSGPAALSQGIVGYRDHLDFEGEVAVLLKAGSPDRFGYLMGNDWTDRGIQVREFDLARQAEVFAKAKAFTGSLGVGPLLAIGNAQVWKGLGLDVYRNGRLQQCIRAAQCVIEPAFLQKDLADEVEKHGLVLAMTGTAGGTIFRTPGSWRRLGLWLINGFSVPRGKEDWLGRLDFLRGGDEVVLKSAILGEARVVIGDPST